MDTIRTFIAVTLSLEIKDSLNDAQRRISISDINAKWVHPENIHVTLKFLGDTPVDKIDDIKGILAAITQKHSTFPVTLKNIGLFPNERKPRVIWAGITEGAHIIAQIAAEIENELKPIGFEKKDRLFVPHITIGRIKSGPSTRKLLDIVDDMQDNDFGQMQVKSITFIKSTLTKDGPLYDIIHEAQLT